MAWARRLRHRTGAAVPRPPFRLALLSSAAVVNAVAAVLASCALPAATTAAPSPAASAAALPAAVAPVERGDRPNIVFVLADDLSWDLVAYMPNVRALAQDGVTFDRFVVSNSLCCPSRASILTGRYPHSTGVWNNTGDHGGFGAFSRSDQRHTYAVALHRAGYRTAMLGKYLNGFAVSHGGRRSMASPIPPGWDEWFVSDGTGYRQFDYWVDVNGRPVHYGGSPGDYGTDVLARTAADFIGRAAGSNQPFMVTVAPFSPHLPATPAPRYRNAFAYAHVPRSPAFNASVASAPSWLRRVSAMPAADVAAADDQFGRRVRAAAAIDDLLGRLRATLASSGVARDTYVVFSSDNGYHLGEHRIWGGKRTAFDTDVRVPTMVAGPGVPGGQTVDALASNVDLAPTFAAIAGAVADRKVQGRSLLPWLHGQHPTRWRDVALVDYLSARMGGLDPDAQPAGSGLPSRYRALRLPDEMFVAYVNGDREFYDLRRDPYELDNVWASLPPGRRAALEAQVSRLASCASGRQCRSAERVR